MQKNINIALLMIDQANRFPHVEQKSVDPKGCEPRKCDRSKHRTLILYGVYSQT